MSIDFPIVLIQILNVTLHNLKCISFKPNFKHNEYNTPDFSPEKTHPQNAASAGDEFVSRDKKFSGKIDTNLAS